MLHNWSQKESNNSKSNNSKILRWALSESIPFLSFEEELEGVHVCAMTPSTN
jgi:hypothetical protein